MIAVRKVFRSASLYKLFVLYEVFYRLTNGSLSGSEILTMSQQALENEPYRWSRQEPRYVAVVEGAARGGRVAAMLPVAVATLLATNWAALRSRRHGMRAV